MTSYTKSAAEILVQGSVAIISGIIIFAALFLPWLSPEYAAIFGLTSPDSMAEMAVPMTLILLSILIIFGGIIHIAGYQVGIQLATLASSITFFISVMVIIISLTSSPSSVALDILIGPWISAAGSIFGTISSKIERV